MALAATSPASRSAFSATSSSEPKPSDNGPPSTSGSSGLGSQQPSHRRVVSTAPPWATLDPEEEQYLRPSSAFSHNNGRTSNGHVASPSHDRFPSDVVSVTSSDPPHQNSWWTFTTPRRKPALRPPPESSVEDNFGNAAQDPESAGTEKSRRRITKRMRPQIMQKNRSSWLFGSRMGTISSAKERDPEKAGDLVEEDENQDVTSNSSGDEHDEEYHEDEERERDAAEAEEERDHFDEAGPSSVGPSRMRMRNLIRRGSSNILRLEMPLPPAPFTKAQAETPGWDSPWNPHRYLTQPDEVHPRDGSMALPNGLGATRQSSHYSNRSNKSNPRRRGSKWVRRGRKLRRYLLHNIYVPLLFRIINLAFTSATLGVAVRIRNVEKHNNVLGIVGPSATLTIIFGPLTLTHVIFAIWLEYFGRPLGLWKTSWKLSYTLLEVVLICAWAAALSLCFNDYLTTPLRCAPLSVNDWWNSLPPQPNPLAAQMRDGEAGNDLCDSQLALICLAYVTLLSYCANLIIALFRIIEKVKFHSNRRPWDTY